MMKKGTSVVGRTASRRDRKHYEKGAIVKEEDGSRRRQRSCICQGYGQEAG